MFKVYIKAKFEIKEDEIWSVRVTKLTTSIGDLKQVMTTERPGPQPNRVNSL